jgi:hypothetical protein
MKYKRWHLKREPEMVVTEKTGRFSRPSYAVVTSTIALVISLASFYFTWFDVRHSLKIGIVSASADGTALPMKFSTDIILLNQGNKTESVLGLELRFGSIGNGYMSNSRLMKGPFVLKAGDAVPVHIDWDLGKDTFEDVADWNGPDLEQTAIGDVILVAEAISPTGNQINRSVVLGWFSYYDPSEEVTFSLTGGEKHDLLELIVEEPPTVTPNKTLKQTVSPSLRSGEPAA